MGRSDEVNNFCHELQVLLSLELTKDERKKISGLLWVYEDNRFEELYRQLMYWVREAKSVVRGRG